jgi:hypothetical protein
MARTGAVCPLSEATSLVESVFNGDGPFRISGFFSSDLAFAGAVGDVFCRCLLGSFFEVTGEVARKTSLELEATGGEDGRRG